MRVEWDQVIHVYFPVTVALCAQLAFLILPVNLRSWRRDVLNAWTYVGIQVFAAGFLFCVMPRVFGVFYLQDLPTFLILACVFIASWWRVLLSIPLESTVPVTTSIPDPPELSFESFYHPDRMRLLGDLAGDAPHTMERRKAVREMLMRRRVERGLTPSEEG
jgi:hypothetical protein